MAKSDYTSLLFIELRTEAEPKETYPNDVELEVVIKLAQPLTDDIVFGAQSLFV